MLFRSVEAGLNNRDDISAVLGADISKMIPRREDSQQFEIWSGIYPEQTDGYCFVGYKMSEEQNSSGMMVEQTIHGGRAVEVGINRGEEVSAARFLLSSWILNRELQPSPPFCLIIRKSSFANLNGKESLLIRVEEVEEKRNTHE